MLTLSGEKRVIAIKVPRLLDERMSWETLIRRIAVLGFENTERMFGTDSPSYTTIRDKLIIDDDGKLLVKQPLEKNPKKGVFVAE